MDNLVDNQEVIYTKENAKVDSYLLENSALSMNAIAFIKTVA